MSGEVSNTLLLYAHDSAILVSKNTLMVWVFFVFQGHEFVIQLIVSFPVLQ